MAPPCQPQQTNAVFIPTLVSNYRVLCQTQIISTDVSQLLMRQSVLFNVRNIRFRQHHVLPPVPIHGITVLHTPQDLQLPMVHVFQYQPEHVQLLVAYRDRLKINPVLHLVLLYNLIIAMQELAGP